jgi:hypothetical protein
VVETRCVGGKIAVALRAEEDFFYEDTSRAVTAPGFRSLRLPLSAVAVGKCRCLALWHGRLNRVVNRGDRLQLRQIFWELC